MEPQRTDSCGTVFLRPQREPSLCVDYMHSSSSSVSLRCQTCCGLTRQEAPNYERVYHTRCIVMVQRLQETLTLGIAGIASLSKLFRDVSEFRGQMISCSRRLSYSEAPRRVRDDTVQNPSEHRTT